MASWPRWWQTWIPAGPRQRQMFRRQRMVATGQVSARDGQPCPLCDGTGLHYVGAYAWVPCPNGCPEDGSDDD